MALTGGENATRGGGSSGQFGRKSLSSSLQAFQRWLNAASVERLLSASIGNDSSLRDILRLARPTPADSQRYLATSLRC